VENTSEHRRTSPDVSRMRYSHKIFNPHSRLKPRYERLEPFLFLANARVYSKAKLFEVSQSHCICPMVPGGSGAISVRNCVKKIEIARRRSMKGVIAK
jgi:hypothetical protein